MVVDVDFGIGTFVPVTDHDTQTVREARAANLHIPAGIQDAIHQTVGRMGNLNHLTAGDQDLEVLKEMSLTRGTHPVPEFLAIRVVMAAVRAAHSAKS